MFAAVPATTFEVSRSRPCGIEQCQTDDADLGLLLSAWGTDDPQVDDNEDGEVNAADLGMFLAAWGNDCTGG